jgi:putative membrane protein
MVSYDPKKWTSLFQFHKADTLRKLVPTIIGITIYCIVVTLIEQHLFHVSADSKISKIAVMHTLLGFVISLLLVFRTNTAYERWWEGRKLWGSLINTSRNMAIKFYHIFEFNSAEKLEIKKLLISFPFALKNHLRNISTMDEYELENLYNIHDLKKPKHLPLHISDLLFKKIIDHQKQNNITLAEALMLDAEAKQLMEICGACERIKNTPIPFSYSVFIKKFIFIYVLTLPIAYASTLSWFAIPVVVFIYYVLTSLELIAEEIENPFGTDANDLPLDEISKNIRKSVEMIFDERTEKN